MMAKAGDNMIKQLTKLANHLDAKGLRKEADYLDVLIRKIATGGPLEDGALTGKEVVEIGEEMIQNSIENFNRKYKEEGMDESSSGNYWGSSGDCNDGKCGKCDYCTQGEPGNETMEEEIRRLIYEDNLVGRDEPIREW